MAKQVITEILRFSDFGYDFTLDFRKPVIALMGDSGAGKTLMVKALKNLVKSGKLPCQIRNFDFTDTEKAVFDFLTSKISSNTDYLCIVDNADILITEEQTVDAIHACNYQVILLGRKNGFYRLTRDKCCILYRDGTQIYTSY